jgi:tetratricopeptide (TPR) repeat protein
LCAFLAAPRADARSAAEIRAQARQVGGAGGDPTAEQHRVEQLGPLVLGFIELSDDAARSGSETSRREELRGAFEAIYEPLNAIYAARSNHIESLAHDVMEQDGDLEALYETKDFRASQAVAAQALYYLSWLDYYGARLYDGGRRKELLEAAEKGFSQFSTGDQKGELIAESQLGRGLCALELGDGDAALRDFKLVIDDPGVSPERQAKARLAMLDAYARAGRSADALRYSDELLRSGQLPPADVPLVKFVRLQILFDAADKSRGADAARARQDASALMEQLRHVGPGWADKVDALMVARVSDPAQWAGQAQSPRVKWELARLMLAKNDADHAVPLLAEIAASSAADAKPLQPEAHYWLGVVRFKANDFGAAADELDAALAAPGDWAGEARYLRFKALEALMSKQATPQLGERYIAAMTDFIEHNPDHPMSDEARYRLGEYRQETGEFDDAIKQYAAVHADSPFALRARFGTLQSRFELLKADSDPHARQAQLDAVGHDLDALRAELDAIKRQPKGAADTGVQEVEAKTTLLRAVYVSLRGGSEEDVATSLADFGRRFPAQPDLLPQALRLRLGALLQLGQFAAAEQALKENTAVLEKEDRVAAIEGLAAGYAKAGARRKAQGEGAAADAASRVALALYQIADGAGGAPDAKQKLTVARLQEATGDWNAAAASYREILQADGNSLAALRGLAHVDEVQGKTADALAHWSAYTAKARPGDPGWYQGQYEQARLTLATGDKRKSCDLLTTLRPSMPGVSDADLRSQLEALYKQACG